MDYRQQIINEERTREFISAIVKVILFFASALLLQFAWKISFTPVFKLPDLTYVQALGFIIFMRALMGFPELGRAHTRRWQMRRQLQNQAFMRRIFLEQKELQDGDER